MKNKPCMTPKDMLKLAKKVQKRFDKEFEILDPKNHSPKDKPKLKVVK